MPPLCCKGIYTLRAVARACVCLCVSSSGYCFLKQVRIGLGLMQNECKHQLPTVCCQKRMKISPLSCYLTLETHQIFTTNLCIPFFFSQRKRWRPSPALSTVSSPQCVTSQAKMKHFFSTFAFFWLACCHGSTLCPEVGV